VSVTLERVVFDHSPGATVDALSIRRNAQVEALPWTRAGNPAGVPSLAAYALASTRSRTITVLAELRIDMPGVPQVRVRARRAPGSSDVLGSLAPKTIALPIATPTTGPLAFTLSAPLMHTRGVGRYRVAWQWEHQTQAPNGPWVAFDTSEHLVYIVLDEPSGPWSQAQPEDPDRPWPWTDVFDWACCWARGVLRSRPAASSRIAAAVAGLGGLGARLADGSTLPIEYSIVPSYALWDGAFDCTAFLRLLSSTPLAATCGVAAGSADEDTTFLNCYDCASAVATFATAIGCGLKTKRLRRADASSFSLNMYWVLGRPRPTRASDVRPESFATHEIAWRDDGGGRVFDACLKVDEDGSPAAFPCSFVDPHDAVFSGTHPLSKNYLTRLVAAADRASCHLEDVDPRPVEIRAAMQPIVTGVLRDLRDRYAGWLDTAPVVPLAVGTAVVIPQELDEFRMAGHVEAPAFLALLSRLAPRSHEWRFRSSTDVRAGFRLAIAEAEGPEQARRVLAWIMALCHTPLSPLDRVEAAAIGDAAFVTPEGDAVFFVRDTLAVRLLNTGPLPPAPLPGLAAQIDQVLLRRGPSG
jgi:hypothetical protein